MEVTQFTYFQQLGGLDLDLIPAEITYGLERLAMFLQGKRTAFELEWAPGVTWGDVYRENERQWSTYNFEHAPSTCSRAASPSTRPSARSCSRGLPLPAYDQVLKCSHAFNLLDARGAISVTERAAYIARVRELARAASRSSTMAEEARCRRCCLRSAVRSSPPPPAGKRRRSSRPLPREHLGAEPGTVLVGPRRLAVLVDDLPERTPTRCAAVRRSGSHSTRKGSRRRRPRGSPARRADRRGVERRDGYVWGTVPGVELAGVLPERLAAFVRGLSFGKSMVWEAGGLRFSRPVRWLCAKLDDGRRPRRDRGVPTGGAPTVIASSPVPSRSPTPSVRRARSAPRESSPTPASAPAGSSQGSMRSAAG